MKKNILTLFVFASMLTLMTSCDKIKEKFEPKYNVGAMVEDYPKYQEQGDTEKVQKLFDKLVELNKKGLMTDDQYFALEPYLTEEELVLFEEEEPVVTEVDYYEDDEEEYTIDEDAQY